jgi:hypothetical protein
MRRFVLALMVVSGTAAAVQAQSTDSLSPLDLAVACAPPASSAPPPADALRVVGSQDPTPRALFGNRDLLVIGGGTAAGVQLGQQFFVRRAITFAGSHAGRGVKTLGWVRVVAVNESTAIALVDQVCGGIVSGDYLAPYVAPAVPADALKDDTSGQPDFGALGHILVGNEDRMAVGVGDFVLIDWGQDQGLTPGARFAIYRDVGIAGAPLSSVGEGIVIATSKATALTRVTRARDAVFSGDYVALRK